MTCHFCADITMLWFCLIPSFWLTRLIGLCSMSTAGITLLLLSTRCPYAAFYEYDEGFRLCILLFWRFRMRVSFKTLVQYSACELAVQSLQPSRLNSWREFLRVLWGRIIKSVLSPSAWDLCIVKPQVLLDELLLFVFGRVARTLSDNAQAVIALVYSPWAASDHCLRLRESRTGFSWPLAVNLIVFKSSYVSIYLHSGMQWWLHFTAGWCLWALGDRTMVVVSLVYSIGYNIDGLYRRWTLAFSKSCIVSFRV